MTVEEDTRGARVLVRHFDIQGDVWLKKRAGRRGSKKSRSASVNFELHRLLPQVSSCCSSIFFISKSYSDYLHSRSLRRPLRRHRYPGRFGCPAAGSSSIAFGRAIGAFGEFMNLKRQRHIALLWVRIDYCGISLIKSQSRFPAKAGTFSGARPASKLSSTQWLR